MESIKMCFMNTQSLYQKSSLTNANLNLPTPFAGFQNVDEKIRKSVVALKFYHKSKQTKHKQ